MPDDYRSGTVTLKVGYKRTELKRWIAAEMRRKNWKKKLLKLGSDPRRPVYKRKSNVDELNTPRFLIAVG